MRTWVRIGDHRSARTVFDDALAGTSEMLVTTAVLELGEITQADALQVVLFYRRHAPQKFERAAIRWLERLAGTGCALDSRATLSMG